MTEPEFRELPGFYVVGYVFRAAEELREEDRGGYWIGQDFPNVSGEDFARTSADTMSSKSVDDRRRNRPRKSAEAAYDALTSDQI